MPRDPDDRRAPSAGADLSQARLRTQELVADETPAGERGPLAGLGAVLSFAVAFGVACSSLGAAFARLPVPTPVSEMKRPSGMYLLKAYYHREHADDFDLLFVGSSRVYREINPVLVDAVFAERGVELRSWNYGIPGVNLPETVFVLDEILARRPERLKWVVIELQETDPAFQEENELTDRQVRWHTPYATWFMLRAVLGSERAWDEKAVAAWSHVHHFAHRACNMGRALPAVRARLKPWLVRPYLGAENTGFTTLDVDARAQPRRYRERAEDFRTRDEELEERLAALRAELDAGPRPDPLAEEMLRLLTARARRAGVEPIYVLMAPGWHALSAYRAAAEREGVALLAYNDPDRHPELYDPRNMYDLDHLGGRGASLFSRTLAADLVDVVRATR